LQLFLLHKCYDMKLIKFGIISCIVLFTMLTAIGLLFPSKIIVSRVIEINKQPKQIVTFINSVAGWKKWIEGVNAIDSVSCKIGNSTIKFIEKSDTLVKQIFIDRQQNQQISQIRLIEAQNKTIVQWQFEQHIKWYPWERFSSMLNDKVIGSMMEIALQNLKKIAE
jgi:hypothetical protein